MTVVISEFTQISYLQLQRADLSLPSQRSSCSEDAHQREYVALSDKRLQFISRSVRASSFLRLGFKPVSTLVSWVSGPSDVDDCIKVQVRVYDHRPMELATSHWLSSSSDVGLQRILVNDLRI